MEKIGTVLKASREKAGLTQIELAEKAGVTRAYYAAGRPVPRGGQGCDL